jgi:hypothetical protein
MSKLKVKVTVIFWSEDQMKCQNENYEHVSGNVSEVSPATLTT